jgi:hypothetical protein
VDWTFSGRGTSAQRKDGLRVLIALPDHLRNTFSSPWGLFSGGGVGEGGVDLAFSVFAADAVGLLLCLPLVTPVGAVAAFGTAVLSLFSYSSLAAG